MDDGGVRGPMVTPNPQADPSPSWLALKMIVYAVAFLATVLVAVPYGFDRLAELLYARADHAWLVPGPTQRIVAGIVAGAGFISYIICSNWLVIVGKGPFVEFDPPTKFVSSGPYRWMRNPVAVSLLITVLGEAVFFGSIGILALFLLGIPLARFQVLRIEEPRLKARFGDSYVEYCRTVPRWLPRRPRPRQPASSP